MPCMRAMRATIPPSRKPFDPECRAQAVLAGRGGLLWLDGVASTPPDDRKLARQGRQHQLNPVVAHAGNGRLAQSATHSAIHVSDPTRLISSGVICASFVQHSMLSRSALPGLRTRICQSRKERRRPTNHRPDEGLPSIAAHSP